MVLAPAFCVYTTSDGRMYAEAAVLVEYPVAEPYAFVAVTATRTYLPTSTAATLYDAVALPSPVALVQPVDPSAETCHWYA